jgi:hypothetical protein
MDPERTPLFNLDERVCDLTPSGSGRVGTVIDIYEFDGVHRYVVTFEDGTDKVFFGFELFKPKGVGA